MPMADIMNPRVSSRDEAYSGIPCAVPRCLSKEAKIPTIIDHLAKHVASSQRFGALPIVSEGLRLLREGSKFLRATLAGAAALPPSAGYEPFFATLEYRGLSARVAAYIVVARGKRVERESRKLLDAVHALKFLAAPRKNRPAILRWMNVLLTVWNQTSILEEIFDAAKLSEGEFIGLLTSAAEGRPVSHDRVREIAAAVGPYLPSGRGRKVSAASASHEFLLQQEWILNPGCENERDNRHAYTWDPVVEDFKDLMTLATRKEFNEPNFDPRSAWRRLKARRLPK